MKMQSLISKQITLLLIALVSLSTLLLPLTTIQAATLSDGMSASYVLGQSDLTSGSLGSSSSTVNGPADILLDDVNDRLYVADYNNNRVLVFDVSTITNGETAINVLGQSDFTSNSFSSTGTSTLGGPNGLALDSTGNRLFVSQKLSNRVSIFDVSTITNGEDAIGVLGQNDFTSSDANRGISAAQGNMNAPQGLAYDQENDHLYVADFLNHRVQIFDVASTTNGEASINVIGQPDFGSTDSDVSVSGMSNPYYVHIDQDGDRLFVSSGHNRITIYDISSITNGEDAINVLGQPDFDSSSASISQSGLNNPDNMFFDSEASYLYVVDGVSNRVVIYDLNTITNGEDAINVLGQPDFTSNGNNYGGALIPDGKGGFTTGTSDKGFSSPESVAYDSVNNLLYVSDASSNRVMIFDLTPTAAAQSSSGWNYIHPPLCSAQFSPNTITKGESTTLSWNATWPTERENNYYVKVPGEGLYSQNVQSLTLQPQHTTEYTIAVFNLWGANFCEAEIIVLDENGQELTSNQNSYLTAGVSNSPFIKAISNFFRSIFAK
jgi:DNA-binding beta-propeller fold protein YncE